MLLYNYTRNDRLRTKTYTCGSKSVPNATTQYDASARRIASIDGEPLWFRADDTGSETASDAVFGRRARSTARRLVA